MMLGTLALLASCCPGDAQDPGPALARAERAYAAFETLTATFTQTIVNPMLGAPETTHGTLYLVKPDRFAMRFSEPEGDRIVADGTWLWAYTPSTVPGQVIRQSVPREGPATPNLFGQFVDRPLERYEATHVGTDTVAGQSADLVRMVPKSRDLPFRQAVIAISRQSGMLLRLELIETSGQRRTLVFADIRPGASVPRSEVTFTPPRGTRVVTP